MKTQTVRDQLKTAGSIIAVLEHPDGRIERHECENLIMSTGDDHYAQRGAAETPTNFTSPVMELYEAGAPAPAKGDNRSVLTGTLVAGSQKAIDGTYPKTNDTDPENTGAGTNVVSWLVTYTGGEANSAAITDVCITNTSPGASEPLLMRAQFAAFGKTAGTVLRFFINHSVTGI